VCALALNGCDPANLGGFRGVAEKVGAKVVSKSSDEEIREMFQKTNKQCPIKMDAFTTLERVDMIDEQTIEFHYKVNDKGRRLVKGISKERMRQNAVEHMKGNAMAVAVAERDLSIQHIYEDRFGAYVLSYTINKAVLNGEGTEGEQQANPFTVTTVNAEPEAVVVSEPAQQAEPTERVEPMEPREAAETSEQSSEVEMEVVPVSDPQPEPADLLPQPYQPETLPGPAGIQGNPFFK
jgi:hypothetical protein